MNHRIAVPASAYEPYCADRLYLASALHTGAYSTLPHDRVLARHLARAFERGVARLAPIPDDDPRWARVFAAWRKRSEEDLFVEDLLDWHLEACPDDDEVRWLRIAFTLFFCDNNFASDLMRALVVREPLNLRWLIAGAVWVYALSGVDTSDWLQEELLRLEDILPDVRGTLERLRAADDAHARWLGAIGASAYEGAKFYLMTDTKGRSWCAFPQGEEKAT